MLCMRLRTPSVLFVSLALCFLTVAPTNAGVQPGTTHSGEGTFYGATGGGNCLFDPTDDIAIAALNEADYDNAAMCGAYLHVTGPLGEITVKVVDRCPGGPGACQPGDIDLSEGAFAQLANPVDGRVPISWSLVSPDIDGPVQYRYQDGSTQHWCGIQVRNHRNPVAMLEVLVGSTWRELPRQMWNYFVSENGEGCGSDIRITDIHGQTLTDSGIALTPQVDQPGSGQFDKQGGAARY